MRFLRYCVLLALPCTALPPAAAQTARIAHLSHGGSLATLDQAADNFGIPPSRFVADSIEILSDSTAREYGKWTGYRPSAEKTTIVQFASCRQGSAHRLSAQTYIANEQKYRPQIKVIKRDTMTAAPAPSLKKQKTKRKKSTFLPTTASATPQHPGVVLAVAFILTLAGAGWLLGERKPQPQPAA